MALKEANCKAAIPLDNQSIRSLVSLWIGSLSLAALLKSSVADCIDLKADFSYILFINNMLTSAWMDKFLSDSLAFSIDLEEY